MEESPSQRTNILPEAVHEAPLGQARARHPDALMHHTLCLDEIADGNVSCDVPRGPRSSLHASPPPDNASL